MTSASSKELDAVRERLPMPSVRLPANRLPAVAIVLGFGVLAGWLFFQLEGLRSEREDDKFSSTGSQIAISSPPELRVTDPPTGPSVSLLGTDQSLGNETVRAQLLPRGIGDEPQFVRPAAPVRSPPDYSVPQEPQYFPSGPSSQFIDQNPGVQTPAPAVTSPRSALIYDGGVQRSQADSADAKADHRASETLRPNIGPRGPNILSQGTVIPAILETPLDTSKGGEVRAVVTENVGGFGASRVLVPRGSRLFGQFGADASGSSDRVAITWNRLLLPDGRQVQIDFPTSDKQGANGIEGRRHTNAFGRFASGILQTMLNIATFRAISAADSDTVVIGSGVQPPQIFEQGTQPLVRVTVPEGTKVNVLVTRAIEF